MPAITNYNDSFPSPPDELQNVKWQADPMPVPIAIVQISGSYPGPYTVQTETAHGLTTGDIAFVQGGGFQPATGTFAVTVFDGTNFSVVGNGLKGAFLFRANAGCVVIPYVNASAYLPAFVGDSGSGGQGGAVPAPPAGSGALGWVLLANGSWGAPGDVSPPSSPPLRIDLQTDGVDNPSQTLLNLIGGDDIILSVSGGDVTISVSPPNVPVTFQTDSSDNALQSLLNLIAGQDIVLTNSGGDVIIAVSPPDTPLILETNGALNASQAMLNLIAGQDIVLTNSGGAVTINVSPPDTPINFADDETPAGTQNGTNQTYTLAHSPYPSGCLLLFYNGVLLIQGTDYTLSGGTITFTHAAPNSSIGESIRCWYRF